MSERMCRPERSVACSDSEKNMAVYGGWNHALGFIRGLFESSSLFVKMTGNISKNGEITDNLKI